MTLRKKLYFQFLDSDILHEHRIKQCTIYKQLVANVGVVNEII